MALAREPASVVFQSPDVLWALALLPLFIAVYLWALARRTRTPVRFSDLDTIVAALGARRSAWRHVPPVLFLGGLIAVIVAGARPVVPLPMPTDQSAIMLSIDVSGSMLSRDVPPSRLEAAKAAAAAFVAALPRRVRIGLVTFAGDAVLHMAPTTDHERLRAAIDAIGVRHRTAIGDGLMAAVAALPGRVPPRADGTLPPLPPGPRPPGFVVLLSDGQNNAGMDPLAAADLAKREDVRVYTVGIGVPITENRWVIGGPLDEETLRAVAHRTGGEYFHPTSGPALRDVYKKLARWIVWTVRPAEATALVAALALLMFLGALAAGWLRHPIQG
jgi:Ca-activated chloride channel family protein